MRGTAVILIGALAAIAGPAAAKTIPVTIHWLGTQPKNVSSAVPGGFQPMTHDAASQTYRGSVEVDGDAPQRRTIVITYDGYSQPIDLRVHRFLDKIEFGVQMAMAQSCTDRGVSMAGRQTTSVPDALTGMLAAGQLLSIQTPNDCDKDLEWQATKARYRQNVRLMQLSSGLFLITPQFEEAYREGTIAIASTAGGSQYSMRGVEAEISEYAAQQASLEAVQFRVARDEAQQQQDFARAAAISDTMYQRVAADEEVAAAYKSEGVLESTLANDTAYLNNIAIARGQTVEQ